MKNTSTLALLAICRALLNGIINLVLTMQSVIAYKNMRMNCSSIVPLANTLVLVIG